MNKPTKAGRTGDDTCTIIADKFGVSTRYVRMVREGKRNNPVILEAYMIMKEGKSELIKAVEALIPIINNY
jgi:hypothetical protein